MKNKYYLLILFSHLILLNDVYAVYVTVVGPQRVKAGTTATVFKSDGTCASVTAPAGSDLVVPANKSPITTSACSATTGEWGCFTRTNPNTYGATFTDNLADCGPNANTVFTTSQSWSVPANVFQLRVKVWGAGGGGGGADTNNDTGAVGGQGGFSIAILPVTPGENLTLTVGSGGIKGTSSTSGFTDGSGSGGGGAHSSIARGSTYLVVSGGGGGGTGADGGNSGNAGSNGNGIALGGTGQNAPTTATVGTGTAGVGNTSVTAPAVAGANGNGMVGGAGGNGNSAPLWAGGAGGSPSGGTGGSGGGSLVAGGGGAGGGALGGGGGAGGNQNKNTGGGGGSGYPATTAYNKTVWMAGTPGTNGYGTDTDRTTKCPVGFQAASGAGTPANGDSGCIIISY